MHHGQVYLPLHTFILSVDIVPEKGPGAKVDEFDLTGLEINEYVLVLHVPVEDSH